AKRPLVRLRDRWVALDPALLERLRGRPPKISTGEALAASLGGGTATVAGEPVQVRLEGGIAELAERIRNAAQPHDEPEPSGLTGVLRPYQRRGLGWLASMCDLGLGGCLADDMGLGKTIQVIALHLRRSAGPSLVVCPASLLGNWERELAQFAPSVPVRRYHGGGRSLEGVADSEVVLVTYGVVRRDGRELAGIPWGLVVADEAQHVKNPLSRGARELRNIPAAARVALTGTPVENKLSDLWSILDWTTPGLLGSLDRFQRGLATPIERYGDPAARDRLAGVVRPFLLRRRKVDPDIAPELPAKTETDLLLPLTGEQATLYEAVVRETMAEIQRSSGITRRGLVLKLLTALKQICNHPAHYLRQAGPLPGRSGKLAALDELLEIIVSEGDSTLVFTQYVAMARLLEVHLRARGIDTAFLHGGLPPRRRDQLVETFQSGRVPVFLLSLKAGGVGLNLTRATHVVHYDRWWNPAVEDQATDRAYRIGQDRPVQVHRLIAQGTVEDRIAALLERKRGLAESVVAAGEGWISELSDRELADLVSLRRVA
ncbi:MAG: DEAD/DEAH box helicase, partial [Candidatus Dormiibacterota bacterium]